MNDRERLINLNMIEDLGSIRIQNLLEHFSSLENIFKAKEEDLKAAKKIGPEIASKIIRSIKDINISNELKLIDKHKIKVITFLDKDYPKNLKDIYDPPVVVYVKGDILPSDDISVAIVGSRIASFYGKEQSEKFAYELAMRGITVVSGLARGIDSKAHKGALKAKGRTLGVLGSGILNIYPEENISLSEDIARNGAVLSQFPMRMPPLRENFPSRNRIISGLSLGVVVVEAGLKSGALITSDFAMEQGREVFALPGKIDSITSDGTNKLIKQGAKLITSIEDIIEEIDVHVSNKTALLRDNLISELDKEESLVYNLLASKPKHIDDILEGSSMDIEELLKSLSKLELKGFIRQLPGKNFIKV
ncbi:MAG: DNA-processing protein DprA [Candidatus Omnitrophota bacterium]